MVSVSIIGGTGSMGKGMTYRLLKAGYKVVIGTREPLRASGVLTGFLDVLYKANWSVALNEQACKMSDVIILTIPYDKREELIVPLLPYLHNKIVIDTTVSPHLIKGSTVSKHEYTSAALELQALTGNTVSVVAAFQNIGAQLLKNDTLVEADVLITGDNQDAKATVMQIGKDMGMQCWDAGDLSFSAYVERLTPLLININKANKFKSAGIRITNSLQIQSEDLRIFSLRNFPEVCKGDDLTSLLIQSLSDNKVKIKEGDVLVIAQKIVSKAEGRMVDLNEVQVSDKANSIANETGKDSRLIQLILNESRELIRVKKNVIIVEQSLGLILANAGIDHSNVLSGFVTLLPANPDTTAHEIRDRLFADTGVKTGVIISDSFGRPWRRGVTGQAIGVAGIEPLIDKCGQKDMYGNLLSATYIAVADSLASAAVLLMGECNEGTPVVIVRGYNKLSEHVGIKPLLRDKEEDLFR